MDHSFRQLQLFPRKESLDKGNGLWLFVEYPNDVPSSSNRSQVSMDKKRTDIDGRRLVAGIRSGRMTVPGTISREFGPSHFLSATLMSNNIAFDKASKFKRLSCRQKLVDILFRHTWMDCDRWFFDIQSHAIITVCIEVFILAISKKVSWEMVGLHALAH